MDQINIHQGVKIGARILDDGVLDKLLPTWKNIDSQINTFRKEAFAFNGNKKVDKYNLDQFNMHYDNVISILGARGTGKTSVLLTLKSKRSKGILKNIDIILPLIIPEDLSETSDILGWIIELLGEEIIRVEQEYKKNGIECVELCDNFKESCRKSKEDTCLKQKYRKLKEAYLFRRQAYFEIINKEYLGKNEYIKDNEEILNADRNIIFKFREFIDELINCKRKVNQNCEQKDQNAEPLIFIFFDDVDISSNRCSEILNSIIKFLTHANIVIFVSGDYDVFFETTTIEFLKKEGLLKSTLMKERFIYDKYKTENQTVVTENTLERKRELSVDYLKKVMPPAFRYEMPVLNDKQKSEFSYTTRSSNELLENENRMTKTLKELIKDSFNIELGNYYFRIFDNTPRGLISVYYHLYQNSELYITNSYLIKQLIDIIISSSKKFLKFQDILKEFIIIDINNINNSIVDYIYLEGICEKFLRKLDNKIDEKLKIVEDFINLCFLGKFVEKILLNNLRVYKLSEIKSPLIMFINKINPNIIPNISNEKFILDFYYNIVKNISENIEKLFSESDETTMMEED